MVRRKMERGDFPLEPEVELEGAAGKEQSAEVNTSPQDKSHLSSKPKDSGRLSSLKSRSPGESSLQLPSKSRTKGQVSAGPRSKSGDKTIDTASNELNRYEEDDFFDRDSDESGAESDGEA